MTTGAEDSYWKRNRYLLYTTAGIIAQTIIIVIFVVFVLRVKTPKVRLDSVAVDGLATNSSSSSPSFKVEINVVVTPRVVVVPVRDKPPRFAHQSHSWTFWFGYPAAKFKQGAGDIPLSLPPERRLPRETGIRHCLHIDVEALKANTPPLDVVELVVRELENIPHFQCWKGISANHIWHC
ncbi:hypothetical protein C1H46_031210 [Malus baccata]|uniref:Uncharacterized protein n=1 Tax=Malus baccata TaxID=106549 RepID=A0A540L9U2_MALBA|nr:hypothetical protein C1H46_031210 [Malus baccata]